jgi:hypothetical protein
MTVENTTDSGGRFCSVLDFGEEGFANLINWGVRYLSLSAFATRFGMLFVTSATLTTTAASATALTALAALTALIFAPRFAALAADLSHVFAILADGFSAFSANITHVLAIFRNSIPAFAGDFSLLLIIHCRKPTLVPLSTTILCHCSSLSLLNAY